MDGKTFTRFYCSLKDISSSGAEVFAANTFLKIASVNRSVTLDLANLKTSERTFGWLYFGITKTNSFITITHSFTVFIILKIGRQTLPTTWTL